MQVLSTCASGPERVLVVGHNPGLAMLVEFLADTPVDVPEGLKFFPTAALAHLRMPADWSRLTAGAGRLVDLVRPRTLDD